jgi:hypothetical protein
VRCANQTNGFPGGGGQDHSLWVEPPGQDSQSAHGQRIGITKGHRMQNHIESAEVIQNLVKSKIALQFSANDTQYMLWNARDIFFLCWRSAAGTLIGPIKLKLTRHQQIRRPPRASSVWEFLKSSVLPTCLSKEREARLNEESFSSMVSETGPTEKQTDRAETGRQTDRHRIEQKAKEHKRAYDNIKELRRTGRDRTDDTRECWERPRLRLALQSRIKSRSKAEAAEAEEAQDVEETKEAAEAAEEEEEEEAAEEAHPKSEEICFSDASNRLWSLKCQKCIKFQQDWSPEVPVSNPWAPK